MSFMIGQMNRHDSKAVVLNISATESVKIRPYWGMMEVNDPLIRFIGGGGCGREKLGLFRVFP